MKNSGALKGLMYPARAAELGVRDPMTCLGRPVTRRGRVGWLRLLSLHLLVLGLLACSPSPDDAPGPAGTSTSSNQGVGKQLPVYHLVDDFETARIEQEVAELKLGTPEARSHLLSGWGADERDDVRTYVWGLGQASTFDLFLTDVFDSQLELHGRALDVPGAAMQTVEVLVNGRVAGQVEVGTEFERRRVDVSADLLQVGVNRFELRYGRHHRPSEVLEGAQDNRPLAVLWYSLAWHGAQDAGTPRAAAETLELPLGSRVSYFQDIEPGDELVLGAVEQGSGVALRVELETADGVQTWDPEPTQPGGPPRRWALPVDGPRLARLSLTARRAEASWWARLASWLGDGPKASTLLPLVLRPEAEVVGKGESSRPDAPSAAGTSTGETPPDILIYLIDTLRADRLGTYGYDRPTSPRIDAFAESGVVFTHAQAQSSWTRTGVTSLFTGMLPQAHGVNRREDALAPQLVTLAESLKEQGYGTVGFITNGNVDAAFGLDQGFDHYQYLRESEENVFFHQTAERLNSWVFKYLDTLAPRGERPPFFLYVHATDPHAPYTPTDEYYERFAAGVDRQRGWLEHVHDISAGREAAPEGTAEAWSDLYDGEIAYTDHHFGKLLDRLQGMGLAESTFVALVSDHGEEFFEHGGWEHGKTLYGEQLRVPLIVRLPAGEGAGLRLPILANQMDVMPTLLDYVGAEMPELVQGQSLLPWIRGAEAAQAAKEPSYAYLRLGDHHQQSVIDRDFKLIVNMVQRPPEHELFHLAVDLEETTNVMRQFDIEEGYLDQSLRQLEARLRGRRTSSSRAEVDEDLQRRLEALGYVD